MKKSPDSGRMIPTDGYHTNCHLAGSGGALLLLHGSGPGVTAMANWRGVLTDFALEHEVAAPDLAGFGYTDRSVSKPFEFMNTWTTQVADLLDKLGHAQVDIIGNSFGGAVALAFAVRHPHRVKRLILMGSAGAPIAIRPELEFAWGYESSLENMRRTLEAMTHDPSVVTDELVELRHEASLTPGFLEAYAKLFPAPRQRWLDALVVPRSDLEHLACPVLLIHGREDRMVQVDSSIYLAENLPEARLEILENCGHWVMMERRERFLELSQNFLGENDDRADRFR